MTIIREPINKWNDLYFIDIKVPKNENWYFSLKKAWDWEHEEKIYWIEWYFKWIKTKEVEIEGKKKTEVQIWLEDRNEEWKEEMYVLRWLFTFPLRSLLNKLLNVELWIKITIWISTFKENHYITVYNQFENWQKVDWKLSWEEQKKMITEVELPSWEIIKDYTNLNNYFIEHLPKFTSETEVTSEEEPKITKEQAEQASKELENFANTPEEKKAEQAKENLDKVEPAQDPQAITQAQINKIHAVIGEIKKINPEKNNNYYKEQMKATYQVESTKDLTKWQASKFIEYLIQEKEAEERLQEVANEEEIPF